MMKKLRLLQVLSFVGILFGQTGSYAQCPPINFSSIQASNDTTLACGASCATLSILNATTTLKSTNTYAVSSIPYAPQSYTAGTAVLVNIDDRWSGVVPLPFPFCFFGNYYTSCVIGSNGQVGFDLTQANAGNPWSFSSGLPGGPSASAVRNTIMGPYHDIDPSVSGTIKWQVLGTAPCRMFVVSWNNVAMFQCNAMKATQQIVLYETTNIIEVNMQSKPVCSGWNGGLAITGIMNANGTVWYTAPGQNGTQYNVTNQSWRFTPTGNPTWNYTWYTAGPPPTPIGTGNPFVVCPPATTTYYVKGVGTSNCDSVVVWDTVTVTKIGTMPPVTGPGSVCVGGNIQLNNAASGGTWTSSNNSIATINTTSGVVTGVSPGTVNITYSISAGCTEYKTVTVYPLDPITGIKNFCQTTTSPLANTASGGTWTSTNTSVATIDVNTGVVTGVSAGTATISYMLPGGCLVTTTVTIYPQLPITGVTQACARGTTMLSNSVAGGSWSISPGTVATIDPTTGQVYGVDPPGPAGGGGTATATYITPNGCVSTVPVTIHPTPAIPTVTTPVAYCQYFTPAVPLVATGGSGATFAWYGPGVTPGSGTAPTPTTDSTGFTNYYVTQTSTYGCTSDSGSIIVYIDARPIKPVAAGKAYCEGETNIIPLDQMVTHTGPLNWYDNNGILLPSMPQPNANQVDYPYGTTWYVSQDSTGHTTCRSDSTAIIDTIKNVPDFSIDTRDWICQNDSMMLKWQNMGMAVNPYYFWQLPDDAYFAGTSVNTDKDVLVKFDSSHSHNFVYLTVSDLGCVAHDTVDIKVVPLPTAFSKTKNDLCMSDTAMLALSAKSSGASRFIWLIDGTPLFSSGALNIMSANTNEGGPFRVQWLDTGKHIIQLQTLTVEGCTSLPVRDTVNVHALPIASFKFKPVRNNLCLDDSVRFVADDSLNATNLYVWTPEHSFNNVNSPIHWGRVEQPNQVISLKVTDPFGCVATYEQKLDPQPCCLVPFPNAFSPNGDGYNDVFRPIQMGNYHRYHFFRIANRWGQTIFSSTDNQIAAWDGTMNGVPQDIGVYYYYLKYDCDGKLMEIKGDVTLVK